MKWLVLVQAAPQLLDHLYIEAPTLEEVCKQVTQEIVAVAQENDAGIAGSFILKLMGMATIDETGLLDDDEEAIH